VTQPRSKPGRQASSFAPTFADRLLTPGLSMVAGVPEGYDALVLAETAQLRGGRPILHVARNDARMARTAEAIAFFAPSLQLLSVPAWDCLPYDRVSPNPEIAAQRLDALATLAERPQGDSSPPLLVLTTVSALLQRVPGRNVLRGSSISATVGDRMDPDALIAFLDRHGYVRMETVSEAGEYAVRGGIIDLFPPGTEDPLRLDFFGDTLDGIRQFDPLTQRTGGKLDSFGIRQVSEVVLEAEAIQRFRASYRELFGAVTDDDPLYEAVSAGRRHAGMEHFLPLFHDRLESLFDYLPDAAVTFDHEADAAREARFEMIRDYYESRRQFADRRRMGEAETPPYKPLPPDSLYLAADELGQMLGDRAVAQFAPHALPDGPERLDAGGRPGRDFAEARARPDLDLFEEVKRTISADREAGRRVVVAGASVGSRERLHGLLGEHQVGNLTKLESWTSLGGLGRDRICVVALGIERGFVAPDLTVIGEADIFGERLTRPARRRRKAEQFLSELSDLAEGDFVVHSDHGIGRYEGLQTLEVGGAPHDCLALTYDGGDKLFVPVENMEVLSRYGAADSGAQLDRLGGAAWQARKARVKKRIRDIADRLIKIAAERQLRRGDMMTASEGAYEEFCARFPYVETDDQLRAIEDVMGDLESGKPMDRLVCGDVGFGKTEVAMRAAFIAVMTGVQVAVVVPTTLLARQHYRVFAERFQGLPIRVGQLSRMVSTKDANVTKAGLKDGSVDVVIGTHALLAKTVGFKRLGMLIIDEEQHFGVRQKEKLKELKADVHVLTLTATPIPRTLQMAMSGVREMSVIATPPVDRLAVRTYVSPYDPVLIREALMREQFRGGQSFYVCPRLSDITQLQEQLKGLVPELKVGVAHGQMPPADLDAVMNGFYDRQFDVLLSTNIVESGLDVPSANTMVIHRADMFGLAQLYQLRGRIGRSKQRAYAYLTVASGKMLTETAKKRLRVMETLDTLGAGFTLASHDMDIRGAGNLLGEEQSGHIREVGIELYQHMLEEAVAAAKGTAEEAAADDGWTPQIGIGTSVLIPEDYVSDLGVRLGLYRRISQLVNSQEIEAFAAEMIDRFGPLPDALENLLKIVAIKQLCRDAGVEKVDAGPKGAVIAFRNNSFASPDKLIRFISGQSGTVNLRPDHRLVYRRNWEAEDKRVAGVHRLMKQLADLAA